MTTGSRSATRSILVSTGVVADIGRDAVAGADDLRDVVDGSSQEDAGLVRAEREPADDHRIDHHRDRRQCSDARDREDQFALRRLVLWKDRGDGDRGRSAADGRRATGQDTDSTRESEHPGQHRPYDDRNDNAADDHNTVVPAEATDLVDRNASRPAVPRRSAGCSARRSRPPALAFPSAATALSAMPSWSA